MQYLKNLCLIIVYLGVLASVNGASSASTKNSDDQECGAEKHSMAVGGFSSSSSPADGWDIQEGKVSTIKENVLFVLEKVTVANKKHWLRFATAENASCPNGGNDYFRCMIESALTDTNDVWVAYARRPTEESNIEIFFAVRSPMDIPITIHNGISKGSKAVLKGLSISLHGFAGAAIRHINPKKQYMYVKPIHPMTSILYSHMPARSLWLQWPNEEEKERQGFCGKYNCSAEGDFPVVFSGENVEIRSADNSWISYKSPIGLSSHLNGDPICISIDTLAAVFNSWVYSIKGDSKYLVG